MNERTQERRRRWSYAVLWVVLIYSTLPVVRPLCEFLRQRIALGFWLTAILGCLLAGIVFLKRDAVRRTATYAGLVLVLCVYAMLFTWISIPEEKIHLLEYGYLAFLIHRAVILDRRGFPAYALAWLFTSLIGWGDEGIQHILPNRYYQWSDVLLNSVGGALGLALTHVLRSEKIHEDR